MVYLYTHTHLHPHPRTVWFLLFTDVCETQVSLFPKYQSCDTTSHGALSCSLLNPTRGSNVGFLIWNTEHSTNWVRTQASAKWACSEPSKAEETCYWFVNVVSLPARTKLKAALHIQHKSKFKCLSQATAVCQGRSPTESWVYLLDKETGMHIAYSYNLHSLLSPLSPVCLCLQSGECNWVRTCSKKERKKQPNFAWLYLSAYPCFTYALIFISEK